MRYVDLPRPGARWQALTCAVVMGLLALTLQAGADDLRPLDIAIGKAAPPPPPPPPARCYYSQSWFPYWSGQGSVPLAKLRVLANGEEIVNKNFCFNELWVWLGDLREDIKDLLEGTLVNRTVSTNYGNFTVQSMTLNKAPFETLLVSMDFQQGGDLDLLALTDDVQATARASGTVKYLGLPIGTASGTIQATLPQVVLDGVLRNLTVEEWEAVWPGAYADTTQFNFQLSNWANACNALRWANLGCGALGFLQRVVNLVAPDLVAGIVEKKGFEVARTRLEQRLDPNDAIASLLGDTSAGDIASAVGQAANALGISIPSPPCGTRFTVYVKNPPSNRSSGGEVTIALFAPL